MAATICALSSSSAARAAASGSTCMISMYRISRSFCVRAEARESRSGPSHPVRRTTDAQIDILVEEVSSIYGCRNRHVTENRPDLGFHDRSGRFEECRLGQVRLEVL